MLVVGTKVICKEPIQKTGGMARFGEVGTVVHTSPTRQLMVVSWKNNEVSIIASESSKKIVELVYVDG